MATAQQSKATNIMLSNEKSDEIGSGHTRLMIALLSCSLSTMIGPATSTRWRVKLLNIRSQMNIRE